MATFRTRDDVFEVIARELEQLEGYVLLRVSSTHFASRQKKQY